MVYMPSIDRDLRVIGSAVRTNIDRVGDVVLKTYTLHELDKAGSRSAMELVDSVGPARRGEAEKAYTETWRTPHAYKVRHLVWDAIKFTKRLAGFIKKA